MEAVALEVWHKPWAAHLEMALLADNRCQALPPAGNGSFDHWKDSKVFPLSNSRKNHRVIQTDFIIYQMAATILSASGMSHGFVHSVLSSFDPNTATGWELYFRSVS